MAIKRAIDAVISTPWAIQHEWLDTICAIAERENEYRGNLEALSVKLGRPLGNTERTTVRDGVAIVPVTGPLFRYANLMTDFSGATSYATLATDFTTALEDASVKSIILSIDSPGGQVNGGSELASLIANARGIKPIIAYIGGTGASAAYWIASAADKIVAADTAIIGSIGVESGFSVAAPADGEKKYRFVSSQSPLKNADPATKAGAEEAKRIVDSLASVFIDTVATNRGVSSQKVLDSYGAGAVFVAADALERGMIDSISTLEQTIKEVSAMDYSKLTAEALASERPDLVAAIKATVQVPDTAAIAQEAAAAERARIIGIEAHAIPGTETLIASLKADPAMTPERAAVQVLQHIKANGMPSAPSAAAAHLSNLRATENNLTPPAAVSDQEAPNAMQNLSAQIAEMKKNGIIRG